MPFDPSAPIIDHHDGHELNKNLRIVAVDTLGPGGAPHLYVVMVRHLDPADPTGSVFIETECARVQFQCGPRNEPGSTPGVTHMAMIALLLHPLRCFQNGPFASRFNALAIDSLEVALNWMHARVRDRAARGVLGVSKA